jgi:hypothetical protein
LLGKHNAAAIAAQPGDCFFDELRVSHITLESPDIRQRRSNLEVTGTTDASPGCGRLFGRAVAD